MIKNKRVSYTLQNKMIHFINHHSNWLNISKSKLVSQCIEECFPMMDEELNYMRKTNGYSLYKHAKKFHNSFPITLTLSEIVVDRLNYYSQELDVKKSHLVEISVYLMDEKVSQELENDIKELMDSSEV